MGAVNIFIHFLRLCQQKFSEPLSYPPLLNQCFFSHDKYLYVMWFFYFSCCFRWSSTPISLKATAGLRLLPSEQAEALLEKVRELFSQYPFVLAKSPVSVMDGSDEGIYGWISVNFLLNRLGGSDSNQFTVGCIDLGGKTLVTGIGEAVWW